MTKQDGNRPTFWKRASKILKKPFGKRKSSPIESSESESEIYSEDESSLDSCSECDSDAGVEKHRVAALRSQEHLNKSDAYKRNALKRQTKLPSKATEAKQAVEKEQRKNRKSATQIPLIRPFAPLLYPNLSPPPSPQPVTYGQAANHNKYQGHRPANNNPFLDSFEDFPANQQYGAPPAQTGYPILNNTNTFLTPNQIAGNLPAAPAFFKAPSYPNPAILPRTATTTNLPPTIPPRRLPATRPRTTNITNSLPPIPPRTAPKVITPSITVTKVNPFLTPQQMIEIYSADADLNVTPLPETHYTPFIYPKSGLKPDQLAELESHDPFRTGPFQSAFSSHTNPFNNQDTKHSHSAHSSELVSLEQGQPTNPFCNQMTHATIADLVKVFGSQQENQAIVLLQNVSPFSGTPSLKGIPSPRFETWIRTFQAIIDTANFDDIRKVKLLSPKLIGVAAESFDDFIKSHTSDRITYALVKQHLMNRFHGAETREMYEKELRNCIKKTAETVLDYAHRLKKLFQQVYPLTDCQRGMADVINMQETMLKDKFLSGLPIKLRERVKFKTFATFDALIKATTKYEVAILELDEERRQIDIVAQITSHSQNIEKQDETQMPQYMKEMHDVHKELVAEIKETQKTFFQQWQNDLKDQEENTPRKQKTTYRNDTQRPQPPYNTDYSFQPPQYFQQNPDYGPQMHPYGLHAPFYTPPYLYPIQVPTYPAHQQNRTMPPPPASPEQNSLNCKRCGRMGHLSKNCRAPAPMNAGNIQCYNCREEGHIARYDPFQRNNQLHQGN